MRKSTRKLKTVLNQLKLETQHNEAYEIKGALRESYSSQVQQQERKRS